MAPKLPTFIGIGVQRAGTTWLYHCLKDHPLVFVPEKKELHFFNINFEKGLDWYLKFFAHAKDELAIGEITPDYYYETAAINRIFDYFPNVKLIISLRNPVDRAYSAYKLFHKSFNELTFEEAFKKNKKLRELGFYHKWLSCVFTLFPRENLHVILYDDIVSSPKMVIRNLYSFLGVDEAFVPPSLQIRYNRIIWPSMQETINKIGLGFMLNLVKRSPISKYIKEIHARHFDKHRACKDIPEYIKNFYQEDIKRLQCLINKDLSNWLV